MSESDMVAYSADFTPRPPCGGRLIAGDDLVDGVQFQSTSSVWRTTRKRCDTGDLYPISIHVLRVEDDVHDWDAPTMLLISIHVLRVEDDKKGNQQLC